MARPKKTRPTKKARKSGPKRNALGRFISREDADFAKQYLKTYGNPVKERLRRTLTKEKKPKRGLSLGKAKTTKSKFWIKTVYRVRGKRNDALNRARDWLRNNARKDDLTWANVGGRTERSRFYGSRGGKKLKTSSFLENEASQYGYGKAKGFNTSKTIVTVEVIVLRKRASKAS